MTKYLPRLPSIRLASLIELQTGFHQGLLQKFLPKTLQRFFLLDVPNENLAGVYYGIPHVLFFFNGIPQEFLIEFLLIFFTELPFGIPAII